MCSSDLKLFLGNSPLGGTLVKQGSLSSCNEPDSGVAVVIQVRALMNRVVRQAKVGNRQKQGRQIQRMVGSQAWVKQGLAGMSETRQSRYSCRAGVVISGSRYPKGRAEE